MSKWVYFWTWWSRVALLTQLADEIRTGEEFSLPLSLVPAILFGIAIGLWRPTK